MENPIQQINQVRDGIKKGQIVGIVLGLIVFAYSMYAVSLSVKANRLSIKKLKSEGFE